MSDLQNSYTPKKRPSLAIPLIIIVCLIIILIVTISFTHNPPVIVRLEPEVVSPNNLLVIYGKGFGDERETNKVKIGGTRLSTDLYKNWSDEAITLRLPGQFDSGMVTVHTREGISNGILITNRNDIPRIIESTIEPGKPHLDSVNPSSGYVGSLITIQGLNFGHQQDTGNVYFSVAEADNLQRQLEVSIPKGFLPCNQLDGDIVSWSDQEITLYLPDGATSGNMCVVTGRGLSNSFYFEVKSYTGNKLLSQKRGYQLHYSVEITDVEASGGNSLDLWIPEVYTGNAQDIMKKNMEPEPLWSGFNGLMRYRLEDLESYRRYVIVQNVWILRYAVETNIMQEKVNFNYNTERELYTRYTSSDRLITLDNELVKRAESIAGWEPNPYLKARLVYYFLQNNYIFDPDKIGFDLNPSAGSKLNSLGYSVFFTGLMRTLEVPTRIVSGYYIKGKQALPHFWTEFYLEHFGWVPVDTAMGDSASVYNLNNMEGRERYYFGNLDNSRISFTRGIADAIRIDQNSEIVDDIYNYSLQTIYEESHGDLIKYKTAWNMISIIDTW